MNQEVNPAPTPARTRSRLPILVAAGTLALFLVGGLLMWRADKRINKTALSSRPKPVTVVRAQAAMYRPSRTYVGALRPWVEASVGPQLISAYVRDVLVRPGAVVKRGDVLATLDCRDASASSRAVAAATRAIDAHQQAVAHEAERTAGLLDGGFVSPNEAERKSSASAAELASLEAERANLARTNLQVNDCILRAPFDGEIARRFADPGAFVRPGSAVVTVVDRSIVRMTADAPEIDFDLIPPGAKVTVHTYATEREVLATITRRSPAADGTTRTVHFEIDIPDPHLQIPVGTTGEVHIEVGSPEPATEIPLYAAAIRDKRAKLFVVDQTGTAHALTVPVKGELGGSLFVDSVLAPGAEVVTEGRATLAEGDRVDSKAARDGQGEDELHRPQATVVSPSPHSAAAVNLTEKAL